MPNAKKSTSFSQEEIEALAKFKAEKEAEAEAQRIANRSLEDVFLDKYTALTEEQDAPTHIMEALATLAAFFYEDDPALRFDVTEVPEGKEWLAHPNIAQFPQGGLLKNLCNNAQYMLDRETRRHFYLLNEAKKARAGDRHGDVDAEKLHFAEMEYGRSKLYTLPMAEDWHKACLAAHLVVTGEEWTKPVKRDTKVSTEEIGERFENYKGRSRL